MHSIDLLLSKLICAAVLTFISFLGAALPQAVVTAGAGPSQHAAWFFARAAQSAFPRPDEFIARGNALSAGLLLGAGLLHFLPSSAEALIALHSNRSNGGGGEVHRACANPHDVGGALSACGALVAVGVLLPLLVERVLVPLAAPSGRRPATARHAPAGAHGHSHGLLGFTGAAEEAGCAAHGSPSSDRDRVVGPDGGGGGSPTSHSAAHGGGGAGLMALLLSVHCAIEGMVLGSAGSVAVLRAAFLALAVHKFFDGFVLGLAVARHQRRRDGAAQTAGPTVIFCHKTVLVWLLVMPVSMVVFGLLTGSLAGPSIARMPGGSESASNGDASGGGEVALQALVQGVGAGCFLYLALELCGEATGEAPAGPPDSVPPASPRLRFGLIVAGFAIVYLMEAAGHSHPS